MPQNRTSPKPPEVMTWGKAAPIIIVALVFDGVRLLFEWFWFFGPALAAAYCSVQVGDVWVVGELLVAGCVAGSTALGIVGAPEIELFGVVMAMAVGFIGWLVIGLWLTMTNARIFKENIPWFVASLLVSEVPLVGSIPVLTSAVVKMYRSQIRADVLALEKYKKEQEHILLYEREQQTAQFIQMQQIRDAEQQAQETATAEAVNDERQAQDEEIPDTVRRAA